MKERIDKLEQKYMDWRNHGTKVFEKATSEKMPVFTRKADEEIAKLKARIAELETENAQLRKEVVEQCATIITLRQKTED